MKTAKEEAKELFSNYYNSIENSTKYNMYKSAKQCALIADGSNDENCSTVWVEDTEAVDGAELNKKDLVSFIEQFYNKFF